jgi:hypothetical protein
MNRKKTGWLLALVLGLFAGQQAHAFYNPSAGKWLNRDPLGEESFLLLPSASRPTSMRHYRRLYSETLKPPYLFVENDPVFSIDLTGLGTWKLEIDNTGESPWYFPSLVVSASYLISKSEGRCCDVYMIKRYARPHLIGAIGTLWWRFDGDGHSPGTTISNIPASAEPDQPGSKLPLVGYVLPYVIDFRWEVYCTVGAHKGQKISELTETIVILGESGSWVGYRGDETTITISDGN